MEHIVETSSFCPALVCKK